MTDNEIIKAIEICAKNRVTRHIDVTYNGMPLRFIFEEILGFVTRQKAEIDRLKGLVSQNEGVLPEYEALIKVEALTEFSERMKAEISDQLLKGSHTWNTFCFSRYEAEAYGEFIDNLVKEMTE